MPSHRRPPQSQAPSAAPAGTLAERLPLRILVADDLQTNQEVLVLMLRHLGYRPTTVADGTQAVAALHAGTFDLLLLDIQMPGLDGYQVAGEVLRLFPRPDRRPKMLAVTHDAPHTARQVREAGMDGLIPKPITLSEVARCLLDVFGGG